jgi:hypothetical protein
LEFATSYVYSASHLLKCFNAMTSQACQATFGLVVHRPPCRTLGQAVERILLVVPSDNSHACSPRGAAVRSGEVGEVRQSIAFVKADRRA